MSSQTDIPEPTRNGPVIATMHVPNPRSLRDSMIAASARQHSLTLVTRNTTHFEVLQVPLLNPL